MLSVVDETDDDWQAITALGSWDAFDAYFQQKWAPSATRSTPPSTSIASESEPYVYNNVVCAYLCNVTMSACGVRVLIISEMIPTLTYHAHARVLPT